MRVVLQRVSQAQVSVDGEQTGAIGQGVLLLLGVSGEDTEQTADRMVDKICRLRIFPDENGKTNLSLGDVGGEILVADPASRERSLIPWDLSLILEELSPSRTNGAALWVLSRAGGVHE